MKEIERIIYPGVYGSANVVGATMATIQFIYFFGTNKKQKTSMKTKKKKKHFTLYN